MLTGGAFEWAEAVLVLLGGACGYCGWVGGREEGNSEGVSVDRMNRGMGRGLPSGISIQFNFYAKCLSFLFVIFAFFSLSGLTKFAPFYSSVLTVLLYIDYGYAHTI